MIAVLFSLCMIAAPQTPADSLHAFLRSTLRARPASGAVDVYKLLYQGAFGVGHLLPSREGALAYIRDELGSMDTGRAEPLLEPCDPDGAMVRVNLRPFAARGLSPETLVDAMLATAARVRPDTAAFTRRWDAVIDLIRRGRLPLSLREARQLAAALRRDGAVPVHHSRAYAEAYAPAYRVVLKSEFQHFFPGAAP